MSQSASSASVTIKAVCRAAAQLGLSVGELARVIGVSESLAARMWRAERVPSLSSKSHELALLLIRLHNALDCVACGDASVSRAWISNEHAVLHARPIDAIQSISGLLNVVSYVEAFQHR
jgi:predicted transcriptional regulator